MKPVRLSGLFILVGAVILLAIVVYSCRDTRDPTREEYLRDDHPAPTEQMRYQAPEDALPPCHFVPEASMSLYDEVIRS
jgi:hypothetical protein